MSPTSIRWVLWVSLVLLAPLPLYLQRWGWVPAYYGVEFIVTQLWVGAAATVKLNLVLVFPQVAAAILVDWLLAEFYIRYTANWPVKLRGSIMGITVLSSLILLSTFALYHLPFLASSSAVNFFQLYQ